MLQRVGARWRQYNLPDQARGLDPGAVVQEGEAFAVAGAVLGDIGDDDAPLLPQAGQEPQEGRGVAARFLDGDDVKPGDDRGQAGDGVPVTLGRIPKLDGKRRNTVGFR